MNGGPSAEKLPALGIERHVGEAKRHRTTQSVSVATCLIAETSDMSC
jgi:hypothetical protein